MIKNGGNNGGGNPNHDELGRFTSGSNKAGGAKKELSRKNDPLMDLFGGLMDTANNLYKKTPEDKVRDMGFVDSNNDDSVEIPTYASKMFYKDNLNKTGRMAITGEDVADVLEDRLGRVLSSQERDMVVNQGLVSNKLLQEAQITNLNEAVDDYYDYLDDEDYWKIED